MALATTPLANLSASKQEELRSAIGFKKTSSISLATAERRRYLNAPPTMSAPPTVTLSAVNAATTITSGVTHNGRPTGGVVNLERFLPLGAAIDKAGVFGVDNNSMGPISPTQGTSTGKAIVRYNCLFDGQVIEWMLSTYGYTYRLWVNGEVVTFAFNSTATAASDTFIRVKVDFGSRALRKVGIESANPLRGATIGPTDTLLADSTTSPKVIFIGDSQGAGPTSWAATCSWLMGWENYWLSCIGGTGYTTNNGGNSTTFAQRLTSDVLTHNPDIVVVAGGVNDGVSLTSTIVGSLLDSILAHTTKPEVLVVTPIGGASPFSAATTAARAAIVAATATRAVSLIDIMSPVLMAGTGKAGATTGSGNADLYLQSDGLHLTDAGHLALGRRAADLMLDKLA